MPQPVIHGADEANQLAAKRMSPRAHRLAWLERWVEGTQYDGLADWFDDEVPLNEKAPCVVEPIVADAIESHVDMVLGEGKFPGITSRPAEDESEDEETDAEDGLDEDDSAALDKLVSGVSEQVRFRAVCREALEWAMGCGTAAAIYGVREGELFGDTVKARWCEPVFGPDGKTVTKLVIQYPYIETFEERGEWKARARIFRREIDDKIDVTFKPADASLDPSSISWEKDGSVPHGLGFCPVIWYPFFRGCSIAGQIDGRAPHAILTDEIHCHDISLSQRHRAARYCGDPQWTEIGVEPGKSPTQTARLPVVPITAKGGEPRGDNPVVGYYGQGNKRQGGMGRKKGPGTVWQYEGKASDVRVELHQLSGDALKAISDDGSDLRLKIMQSLAYVPLDPESSRVLRGTLSGKALESLRERQLNRDDRIRDDFGDGFIKPSMSMLLRICHVTGDSLRIRGLKGARAVLASFDTTPKAVPNAVA
jgi:hypothetical protein